MAGQLDVDHGEFGAGCAAVDAVAGQCQPLAQALAQALSSLTGAAAHPDLASALAGSTRAASQFMELAHTAHVHIASELAATAGTYRAVDEAQGHRLSALLGGAR